MKRLFLIIIFCLLLPIFSCAKEQEIEQEEYIEDEQEVNIRELSILYANKELDSIEYLKETDKLEWYKRYKKIMCKYKYVIDSPLSLFDVYTEEEIRLICQTVETECCGQDFDAKCNVASVIFNRIDNGKYGSTVEEVITSPNQFTYWRTNIPEDTLYAVMYVFEIEDTTDGCLSFNNGSKKEKFSGRSYVFSDSSGHHFYR